MSRPYLQHARRHVRTGSDPIPYDIPYASISTGGSPVSHPGGVDVKQKADFDDAAKFATNSPVDFEYGLDTVDGAVNHTIRILTPGVYLTLLSAFYTAGTAGSILTLYWDNATTPGFQQLGNTDYVYQAGAITNQGSLVEWGYLYDADTVPSGGTLWVETHDTNTVSFAPVLAFIKIADHLDNAMIL